MLSPPIAEDDSSVSMVLTNDALLGEILPRLHSPACYVRAALASKRWLRNASNRATIRGFRSGHSPHLLGIYVLCDGFSRPEFVPLPDAAASCPELEPALRHGKFGFEDLDASTLSVWDCRDERVLYGFGPSFELPLGPAVQTPLRHPREYRVVLPRLPCTICPPHAMLLPDDDDDSSSCYRVDIDQRDQRVIYAKVFVLRAGSWSIHCSASAHLARLPVHILKMTLLMRGTVYMFTTAGYILALDLATAKFSVIDLPEGVRFKYSSNLCSLPGRRLHSLPFPCQWGRAYHLAPEDE
ncbi:hypothetical protein PVAP13_1NG134900 [Panicum virgatum]|uniref:F-box protein AT5G49610-like beta-propeller domain-containing protein n=1 Tax=Panicum virgatum TaxID=38727 RepID=A0A8T0WSB3_PANVG|nr:hypothetical protein PVAP13_1NG134900 [Panicum virgatum]